MKHKFNFSYLHEKWRAYFSWYNKCNELRMDIRFFILGFQKAAMELSIFNDENVVLFFLLLAKIALTVTYCIRGTEKWRYLF
jgi:hypothetical protein